MPAVSKKRPQPSGKLGPPTSRFSSGLALGAGPESLESTHVDAAGSYSLPVFPDPASEDPHQIRIAISVDHVALVLDCRFTLAGLLVFRCDALPMRAGISVGSTRYARHGSRTPSMIWAARRRWLGCGRAHVPNGQTFLPPVANARSL
jgi:hypothetical protein